MLKSVRSASASSFTSTVIFALALGALAPAAPALALICGDTILDPGEDCELPFDLCCDPLTCQFQPSGTSCGVGLGIGDICDPTETCTGTSAACPANVVAPAGTVCRTGAGVGDACDPAETCLGLPLVPCPIDVVLPAATPCRLGSLDACDPTESCTGVAGESCPADVVEPAGTTCRAGSGDLCDPDETCTGTPGATCPLDTVAPFGTTCRSGSGDLCDLDEVCLGLPLVPCPADVVTPAGIPCRPGSLDSCDPIETCTGNAGEACPADVLEPAGTTCRAGSGDACDPDETCTGAPGATCPVDSVALVGTPCRAAGGQCDSEELCSGLPGQACPVDSLAIAGTPCDDGLFCTIVDTCDGSGGCAGTVHDCADANPCTLDSCDEEADECDNDPTPAACDDGNPCTTDACDILTGCSSTAEPFDTCEVAQIGRIAMRDHTNDEKDYVRWSWRRGPALDPSAIGSPDTVTSYALCVFDQTGSVPELVASLTVPPDGELWSLRPNGRAKYLDRAGSVGGVRRIRMRTGEAGRSKAQLGASGGPFDPPAPFDSGVQFDADPALVVQLLNSDDSCWMSTFDAASIRRNVPGRFQAVAR